MEKFTQKDLAYITDMFGWNENALKLANDFLEREKQASNADTEVISILEEAIGMHYENLNRCICILNGQEYTSCYDEDMEDSLECEEDDCRACKTCDSEDEDDDDDDDSEDEEDDDSEDEEDEEDEDDE